MDNDLSSFPLKIRIVSTGEERICNTNSEIPQGISFRVIALRIGRPNVAGLEEFPDVQKEPIETAESVRRNQLNSDTKNLLTYLRNQV